MTILWGMIIVMSNSEKSVKKKQKSGKESRDYAVKVHNRLARYKYPYKSIWEARIFALSVSLIKKNDSQFFEAYIPAKELFAHLENPDSGKPVDPRNYYNKIKSAADHLKTLSFGWEDPEAQRFKYTLFFSEMEYDRGNLKILFNPKMQDWLLDLHDHYTQYSLFEYFKLQTRYGQKLFEYLKSVSSYGKFKVSLEELHSVLNVPNSFRSVYKNFKTNALDVAYEDIRKNTDLKYKYFPVKTGRKITHILFHIEGQKKVELCKPSEQDATEKIFKELHKALKSYGVNEKVAEELAGILSSEYDYRVIIFEKLPSLKQRWENISGDKKVSLGGYINKTLRKIIGQNLENADRSPKPKVVKKTVTTFTPLQLEPKKKKKIKSEEKNIKDKHDADTRENRDIAFENLNAKIQAKLIEKAIAEFEKLNLDTKDLSREVIVTRAKNLALQESFANI